MTYAQIIAEPISPSARVAYATDNELVYYIPPGMTGAEAQVISTETAAIVASIMAGTQEQKQALLPETIVVDHIEVADANIPPGFSIPANSFGRKGSIPYFGDSPITRGQEVALFKTLEDTPTGVLGWNANPLATFDVPASVMNVGVYMMLELDLSFKFTNIGAQFDWLLSLSTNEHDLSSDLLECYLQVGMLWTDISKNRSRLKAKIILAVVESVGSAKIQYVGLVSQGEITVSSGSIAASVVYNLEENVDFFNNSPTTYAPLNVANTIKLFLAAQDGIPANASVQVLGTVRLTAPITI